MADSERMVAIAIGVAGSVPQRYLPGALNGARCLHEWASSQGYEATLITDQEQDVTMVSLRQQVQTILSASNAPIHRIIVYFAGHGLIREMEEGLWLLSDWRAELRAVAVEAFKRRLFMYGPRQVCIISDACRSLPADVEQSDLVPDAVLGAGPKRADPTVAIDKFDATQDGAESFMIPGAGPDDDRCLFSGVLVEGLWGLSGLGKDPFSKLVPDTVTSSSLAAYLSAEVPARARNYGLTLTPRVLPTFPDDDNYYYRRNPQCVPPKFPPWPPGGPIAPAAIPPGPAGISVAEDGRIRAGAGGAQDLSGGFNRIGVPPAKPKPPAPRPSRLSEQLSHQTLPPADSAVLSGVTSTGAAALAIWCPEEIAVAADPNSDIWLLRSVDGPSVAAATPLLLEFADGRFGATVVLPSLFTCLVRDEYGLVGVSYRSLFEPRYITTAGEQALIALENGSLGVDGATDMAAELRQGKHSDPILGVISAYLYDAIGDTDSIRRMAAFYAKLGEAIPYDIALLGGLSGTRSGWGFAVEIPAIKERLPRTDKERMLDWTCCAMPANTGNVGGLWPWMRQGWTLLDDPSDLSSPLVHPGLVELRSGLMRSRFTTLESEAARKLAGIFNLKRSGSIRN